MNKTIMGAGAIIMAILVALTTLLEWPNYLQYIWALIVLIWGIISLAQK